MGAFLSIVLEREKTYRRERERLSVKGEGINQGI